MGSNAWRENLRWKFDVSGRGVFDDTGYLKSLGFFGLDLHKVFTSGNRDVATLLFQPYMTRANDLVPTPPVFDGPDDWELIWRIANVNFKLLQDGALNLRVGHFELPYGLEQTINTNGTLRDYTHGGNFGLKADWGATVNGGPRRPRVRVRLEPRLGQRVSRRRRQRRPQRPPRYPARRGPRSSASPSWTESSRPREGSCPALALGLGRPGLSRTDGLLRRVLHGQGQ